MLQDSQFVDYFILNHTVRRYANRETFGRSKPWWFYLVLVPALRLPWSGILLLYFRKFKLLTSGQKRLFVLWLLVPLVFCSFSGSKLIPYVLPLFAGMGLLVSWLLHTLPATVLRQISMASLFYYTLLSFAALALPFLAAGMELRGLALAFPVFMLLGIFLVWRLLSNSLYQLLLAAAVFTLLLIPYSTHLLGALPQQTKTSTALADALKREGLQDRTIIVYNRLLPSLAFELKRDILSVQDGHSSLAREIQFEKDQAWRNHLLEMERPGDVARLRQLLNGNSVLLVKRELPKGRQWLGRHYRHQERVGEWILYY